MGSATLGQVAMGAMRKQAEQAIEQASKQLAGFRSVASVLVSRFVLELLP